MIDALAHHPHYWDHIEPIWQALPHRGVVRTQGGQNATSDAVLVAGWQDVVRAHKAGYTKIALLEHGIGQSFSSDNSGYPGGIGRELVDLFLSPNATAAGRDQTRYPDKRVEIVGDPHLAGLPRRVPDGKVTVAVSFHWGNGPEPERRSAFDHYAKALPALGREFNVIGHSHPKRDLSGVYKQLGWEYVRSFEEVCRRADVYVCDGVSTLYEFASTGRPVVVLNAPWYRLNVEHGLRFWEAMWIGLNVWNPDELIGTVRDSLNAGEQTYREHALKIVYQPQVDAVEVLLDWLGAAVPA